MRDNLLKVGVLYLSYLIASKRLLIQKLLGMWFTADDIADLFLEELGDIPVARKKLVATIRRCAPQSGAQESDDGGTPKKRRGRPPKGVAGSGAAGSVPGANDAGNGGTNTGMDTGSTATAEAEKSAASVTESVIASAKNAATVATNSPKNSRQSTGNSPEMSGKSAMQGAKGSAKSPEKSAAAAVTANTHAAEKSPAMTTAPATQNGREDSPERQQRFRREAPRWALRYENDSRYGAVVARQDGENDPDYFWRMWHTAPPWADGFPRLESETHTQWIQKCWSQTSPEERAAHDASLPTTAR